MKCSAKQEPNIGVTVYEIRRRASELLLDLGDAFISLNGMKRSSERAGVVPPVVA